MRLFPEKYRHELAGIGFLLPNILGFLLFTMIPMSLSFILAFSNWNLQLHNIYKSNPIEWVGLENFVRLLEHPRFWQYFRNTLFMMMGIPFSIAGSLGAALLLTRKLGSPSRRWILTGFVSSVLVASSAVLVVLGFGLSQVWMIVGLLFATILFGGCLFGTTLYRTLFYTPHFTAGVATYILWKKLYNPQYGPINATLEPLLDGLGAVVNFLPSILGPVFFGVMLGVMSWILWYNAGRLTALYKDGDTGFPAFLLCLLLTVLPAVCCWFWLEPYGSRWPLAVLVFLILLFRMRGAFRSRLSGAPVPPFYRLGENLMFSLGLMVLQFVLIGIGVSLFHLPVWATDGLQPPLWIIDYEWAKPALMIMAFWAAIGSNNMILYIAGLSNVPPELHDAASIDGASRVQQFWHVTWPQLAPVTFFIVVMSIIHGLQGGFEMARTMTEGGPAGATTTLSYFIYIEGFETGRLGFACAVAWALFAMIFIITALNVKFGNRYVND